jgi:ABC-2 type transport system permease protein
MLALLNAERIKLSTTRSTVWIAVAVTALSLALASTQGALAQEPIEPARATLGVAVFGVPVLMVLASMTMTAEYRSGMIRTTFIAAPNRTTVMIAKSVVVCVVSAIYAAILVVCSVIVARAVAAPSRSGEIRLASTEVPHLAAAIGLYAALAAALGVAVGALLRAGPGAVAVLLLVPLVVEPILGNLPDIGARVGPYLPFGNMFVVLDVPWLYPTYAMPWGPLGSLVYFVAVVAVVFAAGITALNMRDA